MKRLFVLILLLATLDTFAQSQLPPLYYLNGEEIDIGNVHINPYSIDDMKVVKETARGAIYITTKTPLTFLDLDMILRSNTGIEDSAGQIIYIIDDKLGLTNQKSKWTPHTL